MHCNIKMQFTEGECRNFSISLMLKSLYILYSHYLCFKTMLRRLSNALYKKQEVHILVLGLDNSGKSSLVQHMKPKKVAFLWRRFEATCTSR